MSSLCNKSDTKDCLILIPNTVKRVGNTTRSGVLLTPRRLEMLSNMDFRV